MTDIELDYWREIVDEALETAGIVATPEQVTIAAAQVARDGSRMRTSSETFSAPPSGSDPMKKQRVAADKKINQLREEIRCHRAALMPLYSLDEWDRRNIRIMEIRQNFGLEF